MSAYAWAECAPCNGGGAVWPNGPRMPSEACGKCRGVGRVCTAEAGPTFDASGKQTGKMQGTHPLGTCVVCRGLVTKAFHEADKRSLQALDLADANRSQERRFTEMGARLGENYEGRFAGQLSAMQEEIDKLKQGQLGFVDKVKQLASGKGKTKKKAEKAE